LNPTNNDVTVGKGTEVIELQPVAPLEKHSAPHPFQQKITPTEREIIEDLVS